MRTLTLFTFATIAGGMATLAGGVAQADSEGMAVTQEHEHLAVTVDAGLTLAEVLSIAVDRHPGSVVTRARREEAVALSDRGASWIAGPVTASLRYQTDRLGGSGFLGDDVGLREFEPTLTLPIWRPGQRGLAREVGSAASEASVAARQSHALQVAGELRELLWHVDELERSVAVAEQAASLSRRRIGVVDRMIEVGELASAEGLLVRREALAQEELLLESRAQLVDAWYLYRSLTGLERRPPALMEPVASLAERSLEEHPTMLLADAERARRAAAAEAAVKAARGQPSIVLGPRSERPFAGAEAADSFGIILSVPFGGGSHVRARSAPAVRAEAAAEAELARVRRALELARHDAEHELEVIRGLLGLSRERRDAATEYARLARTAFQGGELGLRELLRGEASALGAELELIRRESALGLAVARVNGAAGVLP